MFEGRTKEGWKIMPMKFSDFKNALLSKRGESWDNLTSCECIFGGLDIGFDFMLVYANYLKPS